MLACNRYVLQTLFSEPTRPKVVAVVVDKNHNEQKLMRKPQSALSPAATRNLGFDIAGSEIMVLNSPFKPAVMQSSGNDNKLL